MDKRGEGVSRFSVVLFKLRNEGKVWDSNPYLPLQNPVVQPAVPWEQLEFLTNVNEIIIFGTTDSNPDLPLQNPVVQPHCAVGTIGIEFDKCQRNQKYLALQRLEPGPTA